MLGPNGSGKTTTIKTLAGLIKKNKGIITSFDINIDLDFENYIKQIGFSFDRANYYPFISGYDNLKFFVDTYKKCSKAEILRCVEEVGLSKRIFDKVSTYSFGMRQRLNFAKSVLTSAKVIVLDEPFNGIDPQGKAEIRELILKLRREKGISFFVSSHLLDEIESISDRILFYKSGTIVKNICVNDYISFNHYITIRNPDDSLGNTLFEKYNNIDHVCEDTLKINCSENDLNDVLHILYKNGYIVLSVSSKKSIEDLYIKTVGGNQIE